MRDFKYMESIKAKEFHFESFFDWKKSGEEYEAIYIDVNYYRFDLFYDCIIALCSKEEYLSMSEDEQFDRLRVGCRLRDNTVNKFMFYGSDIRHFITNHQARTYRAEDEIKEKVKYIKQEDNAGFRDGIVLYKRGGE